MVRAEPRRQRSRRVYDVEHVDELVDEQELEVGADESEVDQDGIALKEWVARVDAILEPAP